MSQNNPLLLLLDSVLSQDQGNIKNARFRICSLLGNAGGKRPSSDVGSECAFDLTKDVKELLDAFPNLVSIPSSHDGSLPLHFAASIGDVQVANLVFSMYPEAATTPNTKGKIPLHYAAREGRTHMVAFFMHMAPHTASIRSKKQKLAIHFAAGDGHTEVVRQLLRVCPEGASTPSSKGKLPLHFAARWGHIEIASDLLSVYPDGIQMVDWEGSLPLHDAAREGQCAMSRFLIERYPVGLSTSNIRGEIPLFPVVRTKNLDLVILYLQAWPAGGKHILMAAKAEDCVHNWGWNIIELCLRGAVGNFSDCILLEGRDPPTVVCNQKGDHFITFKDNDKKERLEIETTIPAGEGGQGLWMHDTGGLPEDTFPRCKSPILEDAGSRKKRAASALSGERKRARCCSVQDDDVLDCWDSFLRPKREFIPLHAALESEASIHVIEFVMKKCSADLQKKDCFGRLPLHLATQSYSCENDGVELLLNGILKPFPEAAFVRDNENRLPLHIALQARADFKVVDGLIKANPSSGINKCGCIGEFFAQKTPVFMAMAFGCDISTLYLLCRLDPSSLQR